MFHEQIINFLEAAIVFLLLTNAASAMAATHAMRLLNQRTGVTRTPTNIERKLNAILGLNA
jgi:hypothetical protein